MARDLRPASSAGSKTVDASNGFIEHHVSKLDTLAGVAIKYGVEVADVKRSNGLVSDFQMFAHNTLRIPVSRRHPASSTVIRPEDPSLSGCPLSSKHSPKLSIQMEMIKHHERRVRDKRPSSSAMNMLRGYYGLSSPAAQQAAADGKTDTGMEMASYKAETEQLSDDEPFSPIVPVKDLRHDGINPNGAHISSRPNGNGRDSVWKSTNSEQISNSGGLQNLAASAGDTGNSERYVRRRFKPEAVNLLAICDDANDSKRDMGILDKSLPASAFVGATESSGGLPDVILKVLDGALVGGGSRAKESLVKVKKSSSTSSLQDEISSKGEKSASLFNQGGSRMASSDAPPKPSNYRFKAALD